MTPIDLDVFNTLIDKRLGKMEADMEQYAEEGSHHTAGKLELVRVGILKARHIANLGDCHIKEGN